MKKIIIENWQEHGDYMLYANMVDEVGTWIMLQSTASTITAIGKDLDKFCKLLDKKKIKYSHA